MRWLSKWCPFLFLLILEITVVQIWKEDVESTTFAVAAARNCRRWWWGSYGVLQRIFLAFLLLKVCELCVERMNTEVAPGNTSGISAVFTWKSGRSCRCCLVHKLDEYISCFKASNVHINMDWKRDTERERRSLHQCRPIQSSNLLQHTLRSERIYATASIANTRIEGFLLLTQMS